MSPEKLAEDRAAVLAQALRQKRNSGLVDTGPEALLLVGDAVVWALRELVAEVRGLRGTAAAIAADLQARTAAEEAVAPPAFGPVTTALLALVDGEPGQRLEATAAQILARLAHHAPEDVRGSKLWPSSARALSVALRRLAPELRRAGLELEQGSGAARRVWSVRRRAAEPDGDAEPSAAFVPAIAEADARGGMRAVVGADQV